MSDDLVEIARGSHGEAWYTDDTMKEPRLLQHVLADEITRLHAELATARRDGMEQAAKRLEELHKNHGYNPQTGEVWRLGKIVTCPLTIDHAIGYYRAIAEGVAHIRAAAREGQA